MSHFRPAGLDSSLERLPLTHLSFGRDKGSFCPQGGFGVDPRGVTPVGQGSGTGHPWRLLERPGTSPHAPLGTRGPRIWALSSAVLPPRGPLASRLCYSGMSHTVRRAPSPGPSPPGLALREGRGQGMRTQILPQRLSPDATGHPVKWGEKLTLNPRVRHRRPSTEVTPGRCC